MIDWNKELLFFAEQTRVWFENNGNATTFVKGLLFCIPQALVYCEGRLRRRKLAFQIALGFIKNIFDFGEEMEIVDVFQDLAVWCAHDQAFKWNHRPSKELGRSRVRF